MKKYVILAVIALFTTAGTAFAQRTISKSFSGVKRIKLSTASGDCQIKKSSSANVEVELIHSYDESHYSPRFDQSGDRLTIGESRYGQYNGPGNVQWKLAVPEGIVIDFTTGSGNLYVADVNLNIDANTGSGDLDFSGVKGELDLNTGSGNVDVATFSGYAKINTGSGDMDLRESSGDIDLNCGSGDIKVSQTKGTFTINTGSGNINADKITVEASSRFNTGSGRAKVTLAATPKSDLSVNAGSGDAELNFNGNPIVGEIVMKASKRHGRISAPFTFDKEEEESYGNGNDNVTIVKTAKKGNGTNRITVSTGSGDAVLRQ